MIKVLGSKLIIEGSPCAKGVIATQEIDLTPFHGQFVRAYLDDNLNITINPHRNQFWQLAELYVPLQKRDASGALLPLDLSAVQITTFQLPL